MSNLSDDTLKRILQQIQTQAVSSQRQLGVVRAQTQAKEKERRILELTMRELDTVPAGEGRMFRGVGKMFIQQPRAEINSKHEATKYSLNEDISSLQKKAKYLERQLDEANSQLRDIFHSQQREAARQ
ncbi:hypothetical protein CspeluHIS016_0304100 [Cutaneotrichosporon spelunceum]|uniref:Prefoldin n=1 Tax=Cutaneotrichosporon spelunceum TaxID=1672016 RepID=A0AAD3YB07_9TREE|nr:hypothetical protein CspeluHIS016_0304100 [Cutaneotrichosporon spelunceum]